MIRLIHQALVQWENKKRRKPLLVTGGRQCGKTFSLMAFGKSEFEDVAYINFENNKTRRMCSLHIGAFKPGVSRDSRGR